MSKKRVHELAKELGVDWKDLQTKGKLLGIEITTAQNMLSDDDALKLKKAASSPAVDSASAKTVVIRRRAAPTPEPTPAVAAPVIAAPVVAAPVVPAPVVPAPVVAAAVAATPVVAAPVVSSSTASTPVAVAPTERTQTAATEASESLADKSKTVGAAATTAAQVATQVAAMDTGTAGSTAEAVTAKSVERASASEVPEAAVVEAPPKRRAPPLGGATIVRRASPEEIEAQKKRELEAAEAHGNRTVRREDNRGVRVSGMGLLSSRDRTEQAPGARAPAFSGAPGGTTTSTPAAPGLVDDWGAPRKDRGRIEAPADETEGGKLGVKNLKQKRANLNMRTLLNQFEENDDAVDAPEADVQARVFTPAAASRYTTRRDVKRRKDLKKTTITTPRAEYRIIEMEGMITVSELARQLSVKAIDVIKKLMSMGVMATMNQELDVDTATLIASEYKFELQNKELTAEDIMSENSVETDVGDAEERPPIVTIMGHVDHGKTSLLDAIRSAKVAAGEAGGITQHIGAYTVDYKNKKIAFLDTPGHEAFSAMRARGASLTDIVILVVAADDGVMPQTIEAINHAKAAGVPIIVAVNKIDKPNLNLDRLFSQLSEHGIQSEEWGGENQFVKTSAIKRVGLDEILDAILLQAEVLDLKASHVGPATGTVVEAHLDKGRGPVATVMVQTGTLQIGQYVVAGRTFGRVRAMIDHTGQRLQFVGPSTPVEVVGLAGIPSAGDKVNAVADERTAREIVALREEQERRSHVGKSSAASLEDLMAKVQNSDRPELALIVKADVQGSLEAVCDAILKQSGDKVVNKIVHRAVGGITESDFDLAKATGAVLVGFNVRAARGLDDLADKGGVVLKYFSIIYELVDAVKAIMAGKLPPIVTESVLGHAEVRQTISVPKIGTIAGSSVLDGKITRQSKLRLIRDSVVIYQGRISSLRRFKDDVREVATGYECGIGIDGYADIRIGDVIEAFELQESAPTL
jgi:translation initiation factor IF-2